MSAKGCMTLKHLGPMPARLFALAAVVLLLLAPVPLVSGSSKYACDYTNRLCQWDASYLFGATVMGDLAFFNGGILSSDASTPVNGSALEVLDLRTMSPLVIQVEHNKELMSSRYRHQLVVWKEKILAVGGQADDFTGASQKTLNVIELDLNTRIWQLRKHFTQPGGSVDIVFEASVVVDDQLLVVFVSLPSSDAFDSPTRQFLSLNLNTRVIEHNFYLAEGVVEVLDWPLIGVMTLGKDGDFPHLVVQSKRRLPKVNAGETLWYEVTNIGDIGVEGPLNFTATTHLKELPGGDGGKVLSLTILQVLNQPTLMTWTVTAANFAGGRQETVNAISMYDVTLIKDAKGKHNIALKHCKLFLTLPVSMSVFKSLQSVDLPWHGNVAVSATDVIALPYVGNVDIIGELDSSNVNIQNWPNRGFIIRGSSFPDPLCQPNATWQPFVLTVDLKSSATTSTPVVRAVSNSTWCSSWQAQQAASAIVGNAAAVEANTKLYTVDTEAGPMLTVMSAQRTTSPGGQLMITNPTLPLQGVFISVANSSVQNFSIPTTGYQFPLGFASCMAHLAGMPMYLEHGGWYYDDADEGTPKAEAGFVAVPMQLGKPVQPMLKVGGSKPVKGAVFSSLACTPDGSVYRFGGLELQRYDKQPVADADYDGKMDVFMPVPVWAATSQLQVAKLGGSLAAPTLSQLQQLGPAASTNSSASNSNIPNPRSGHTLTYLAPESVASLSLGLSKGGLLLYGGSNFSDPSMSEILINETITMKALSNVTFDRTAWLFDLGSSKWLKLVPGGVSDAPPGLTYHSASVQGKQLMVWGGLRFVPENKTMKLSRDMYILDFSESTPRWRKAPVDNINVQGAFQLAFPNTGIATLPESGVVALMHRSGISLTPIPQSLQLTWSGVVANWWLTSFNLTSGDWVRLETPHNSPLILQAPLTLGSRTGGFTISGVKSPARGGDHITRGLLGMQSRSMPTVECGPNITTAVLYRSSSVVLDGLVITGCNGSAINVTTDSTGFYPTPAKLRDITIIGNKGNQGAAVQIGPAAAAVLEDCVISHNSASDSTVFADTTSQLTLSNTEISNNIGSGVVFAGSHLNILRSRFLNNTSHLHAPHKASNRSLQQSVTSGGSGGAVRIWCVGSVVAGPAILTGCSSNTTIVNSTFNGNKAQLVGGAVYLGAGTLAHLEGNNFSSNMAADGGAILADRDACLLTLRGSQLRFNNASGRGGAVVMRGATCQLKMLIEDVAFRNNTAGLHGGAMYLDEMINRNIVIKATSFMYNKVNVTLQQAVPATSTSRALEVGHGGALYLGLWNSRVTISNAAFLLNSATGCGGALEIMSIEGDVALINTTAQNNIAVRKVNPSDRSDSRGLTGCTSEGGAIHVQGSTGRLALVAVDISANQAEKGGGISMDTASGSFSCARCNFLGNIASLAGGAVSVTERKVATISNSTFKRNALVWPDSSAGGGFYCYFCEQVNLTRSLFVSNMACYGGGAAILQAIRPSTIADTVFARNIAYCGGYTGHQGPRRSRALLATTVSSALNAAVGSSAVNVIGDNGVYKGGGGGLYVSVQGSVNLKGSCFAENKAVNGGGLLSRTDVCDSTSASPEHCQLALSATSILDSNKATGTGDGVLITKVSHPWVSLGNCSMGSELNLTTSMGCLRAVNKLCQEQGHANKASFGQDPVAVPLAAAVDGTLSYMATSAAKLECLVSINGKWVAEDCSEAIYAAPGMTITVALRLVDALGKRIMSGMYDATMPMSASLFKQDGITQPSVLMLGNNTYAVNGTGYFTALSINGKSGSRYKLVFRTGNGLNLTRQLILRECQAGEHDQVLPVSTDGSNVCHACTSPQYSFYPQATRCGQCGSLGSERFAVCDSAAVVPANGFYQSHPRNPLLHRCSTAAACSRSKGSEGQMAEWAARHARLNIKQLNQINQQTCQPYYQPYVDHMCAPGYTGPLCGGCSDGHGHSGHRCVQCMSRNANNFCYLLISVFMLLVPALQTFLHSKDVQKRQQHMQQPGLGFVTGVNLSTPQCSLPDSLAPVGSGNAAMQKDTRNIHGSIDADVEMVPVGATHSQQAQVAGPLCSWPDTTRHDQNLTIGSNPSGTLGSIRPCTSAEVRGIDEPCTVEPLSRSASGSSISIGPFGAPGHAANQAAQHTGQRLTPAAAGTALLQPAQTSHQPGSSGLVSRLFSTEPLHRTRTLLNRAASSPAQSGVASYKAKQPTPAPALAGNAPPATGTSPKFYHSDVLTMLVSYMQLLGLLRLVQLDWSNWDKAVDITLTFLDFTAGVSTWISIECSFADNWPLPKSLKRSLVLILWPVGALLFLGILWLTCAYIVAQVSRRKHRARGVTVFQQVKKLQPYMVLSAVTLLYYLYTPTSREVILLFSCQPVDTIKALQHIAPESASTSDAVDALRNLTPTNSSWPGVWASDTSVKCDSAAHMAMAFGLGVPGMVFWVFGLPVALWVLLKRHSRRDEQGRCKLEWPSVELKYGLMYDKYRYRRYYWECVVLLENCVLTMLLVMLQSQPAPLQILVAMTVIFIGVLLHITFRPYAVNLLDTLRRLAVYALMCTLFCMMLVSMAEYKDTTILPLAALIVIAVANVSVLGIHIWAVVSELRRWMRYELSVSNRRLSWNIVWNLLRRVKPQGCMPKSGGAV